METVEEMVTHAMVKQLRLPDLEAPEGADQESKDEECKDAEEEKQAEQPEFLPCLNLSPVFIRKGKECIVIFLWLFDFAKNKRILAIKFANPFFW